MKLLDGRGMVALMILKHYTCLSDQKLLHRLNTDYAMQYFCGIELRNGKLIKDNAFNESTTLKDSVAKSEGLLVKVKKLGADQIYATNDNRNYLTEEKIITNFARKGPKTAIDPNSETRKKLGILRSTSLEGSFGNEKNHYGLNKIKAKSKSTELTWLYFGIITCNVVKISEQREQLKKEKEIKSKKAA